MFRVVSKGITRRLLSTTAVRCEATVFQMPAMSPTMEAGGIVEWKVKEGQAFSSGDPILDVETDKATISVDAIDDGIMAKILLQDGAKDIPVGTPIAVTAEPGDDLATLEMPNLEAEQPKETAAKAPEPVKNEKVQSQPVNTQHIEAEFGKADVNQTFFPSVELLLHEKGISREEALSKITATGPAGRILKGDVLAYLGVISKDQNVSIAQYIQSHAHLDLSNIELRKPEVTSADINAKSSETSKDTKPAKKEPVVVSREFVFDKDLKTLSQLIKQAEKAAYATPEVKSDLTDPLFEALITPSRSVDRFAIAYDLNKATSILNVNLTLNEKAYDSNDKAQTFLNSLQASIEN